MLPGQDGVRVCRDAFRMVLNIGHAALQRLLACQRADPLRLADGRGKHSKGNNMNDERTELAIGSFGKKCIGGSDRSECVCPW